MKFCVGDKVRINDETCRHLSIQKEGVIVYIERDNAIVDIEGEGEWVFSEELLEYADRMC